MHILISSASYLFSDRSDTGESRVVLGIVRELAARGHTLHVLAPRVDLARPLPNTVVHEVGGYVIDADRDYFRYRLDTWRFAIQAFLLARRLIASRRIDVVHHIRPAFVGRFSLCVRVAKPFLYGPITPSWENVGSEDVEAPRQRRSLTRSVFIRCLHLADATLGRRLWRETLSGAAEILAQIPKALEGLPTEVAHRTRLVGLGVDVARFTVGSDPEHPTILFLGKLVRRKGLGYLIDAMPAVRGRFPKAKLLVVGSGPARAEFEQRTIEVGVADAVDFVGPVPHAQTPDWYRRASLFCLPSVGEPAANTLLEAMACGLPIVATDAGGVPDIVDRDQSGQLVPPRDPDALARAVIYLLEDAGRREAVRDFNRELAVGRHSIARLVDGVESAYRCAMRGTA